MPVDKPLLKYRLRNLKKSKYTKCACRMLLISILLVFVSILCVGSGIGFIFAVKNEYVDESGNLHFTEAAVIFSVGAGIGAMLIVLIVFLSTLSFISLWKCFSECCPKKDFIDDEFDVKLRDDELAGIEQNDERDDERDDESDESDERGDAESLLEKKDKKFGLGNE